MKNSTIQKSTVVFIFLMLAGFAGFSQETVTRTDKRQVAQRARIHEGRRDGEVTNREAAALNAEQRHIRRSERRAKADGEVTAEEQKRLNRKQNRSSRHIRRAKHNEKDNN